MRIDPRRARRALPRGVLVASLAAMLLALAATGCRETRTVSGGRDPGGPFHAELGPLKAPSVAPDVVELDYTRGLEATINGQGPLRVGFDTGQSVPLHFTRAAAEGLDLPVVGSSPVGDGSGKGAITADIVRVDEFVLGGQRFTDVTGIVFDGIPGSGEAGGINFGFPLFGDRLFTLNVGTGRIAFRHGALDPDDPDVVPFTMPRGLARVPIRIGEEELAATVDSGSPNALTMPTTWMDRLPLWDEPVVVGRMATLFNEFDIYRSTLGEDVHVGSQRLDNPEVLFTDHLPDVILGREALRHLELTFDQVNRLVLVLPSDLDSPERLGR